jgi:L-fuconolactonase
MILLTFKRNGYSVDICIKGNKQLENIISVIQSLPSDITIIIDHIAKPFIEKQIFEPWKELLSRLSNNLNVYCKISGIKNRLLISFVIYFVFMF